jgi:hypothetical protein
MPTEKFSIVEAAKDDIDGNCYRVVLMDEDETGCRSVADIIQAPTLKQVVRYAVNVYHEEIKSVQVKRIPLNFKTKKATINQIIKYSGFSGTDADFK